MPLPGHGELTTPKIAKASWHQDGVFGIQSQKTLKRGTIPHLILHLIIGEVVKRLQHQQLEHKNLIKVFSNGMALTRLLINCFQQGVETVPVQ